MVKITGLGSFREVGRSSILVEGSQRFIFDYGLSVQDMGVPTPPKLPLDGVLLSHAHLDHCGMIPELYKRGMQGKTFATATTLDLIGLMLRDSIKVQQKKGLMPFFRMQDIEAMERHSREIQMGRRMALKDSAITYNDAGHVPGSASILLEMDGKRILYTGDIKFQETELMNRAFTDFRDIDLLICEATYSRGDHPDRKELKKELISHVLDVYNNNGITLFPCFSMGRTQEMLLLLADLDMPIYLDGMGAKATGLILQENSVKNPKRLRRAYSKARKIRHEGDRANVIRHPGVVIATAGMMNGGPVSYYMRKLHMKENCSLYLSGFQAPDTVGRALQDTGRYVNEDVNVKPKMQVMFRDWSAHAGRTGILDFIRKVRPKKTLFNHGDSCREFAEDVSRMGFPAIAPANNEPFHI